MRRVNGVQAFLGVVFVLTVGGTSRPAWAQEAASSASTAPKGAGALLFATVPAPSLSGSLYGIPSEQPAAVYLPPSYRGSSQRYPVLYFLVGFGDQIQMYTQWGIYQGFFLKESIDKLVQDGKIREMIVVIPNGLQFMMGSFYVNSPLNGNWEDYVVRDVVGYVDKNYRTIASPSSRGIAGHSMGGTGAINLAMRHPDVFGITYALSPGLSAPEALKGHVMFQPQTIEKVLSKNEELAKLPTCEAKVRFMSYVNYLVNSFDMSTLFAYAYGAAFAPNPGGKVPSIEFPYSRSGGQLVLDPAIWAKYERGFGDLTRKVTRYRENLLKLKSITIDVGLKDEHAWIPTGCAFFSKLLDEQKVPHRILRHEGDHQNKLRERIELYLLPAMSAGFGNP